MNPKGTTHVGTCKAASITKPINIVDIKVKHGEGKSNKDVERFSFRNTEVHFLPRGLGGIFINLTVLAVDNCGLKAISRQDLIGFGLLESLCLMRNKLKSLPDDLLTDMPKLQFVNFEDNLLERLSSKLLEPIRDQLLFAAFIRNPHINASFMKGQDLNAFMKMLDENHLPPIEASSTMSEPVATNFEQSHEAATTGASSTMSETRSSNTAQSLETATTEELATTSETGASNTARSLETATTEALVITPDAGSSNSATTQKSPSSQDKEEEFFEKGKFSDCTLLVGANKFKVHKFVLAAQSPYFDRVFSEAQGNVQQFEILSPFSTISLEIFLRFFYNGSTIRNDSNAVEIFHFAHQFEVEALKTRCEEIILQQINESNVIEVYNLGHRYESEKLKQAAFKVIQELFPGTSDDCIDQANQMNELISAKRRLEDLVQSAKRFKKVS